MRINVNQWLFPTFLGNVSIDSSSARVQRLGVDRGDRRGQASPHEDGGQAIDPVILVQVLHTLPRHGTDRLSKSRLKVTTVWQRFRRLELGHSNEKEMSRRCFVERSLQT